MADWIEDAEAKLNESSKVAAVNMHRKNKILNMGLLHKDNLITGVGLYLKTLNGCGQGLLPKFRFGSLKDMSASGQEQLFKANIYGAMSGASGYL